MDSTDSPAAGSTATTDAILSAIRTLLGAGLGYLAGKGIISPDQVTPLGTALIIIAPVLWGVIEKFRAETQVQTRIAAAVAASPDTTKGV